LIPTDARHLSQETPRKRTEAHLLAVRTTLLCAILNSIVLGSFCDAGEAVEDLLAGTFRITDGEHSGTCFLVTNQAVDFGASRHVILVTAKHVLDQMNGPQCDLILRTSSEQGYSRSVVPIQIRNENKRRWTQHPDVDIASLQVELPEDTAAKPIPFEQIADEASLIDRTVRVGQEVWIACFPAKLEVNDAGWPVLRKGSIASYPLLPVSTNKTMLVDYNVFGGDSGAPVAIIVNNRPFIVGVASSMHRQTDRSSLPFEDRVMHTPMGLSIVVQAAYLRDTIKFMKQE
jgi:hypothetical protein